MKNILFMVLCVKWGLCWGQLPQPALVGYWHNWNDGNAPYIALDQIDDRYNVIEVSFAIPAGAGNMNMTFTPDIVSQSTLTAQIQTLQNQGKKVLLSIGGATASIDLTSTSDMEDFIASVNGLINTYGFDGIDIDIESGNSIYINGGTIASPGGVAQINLINAIRQIMTDFRSTFGHKMLLTMAPETAYVQGGQSGFGSIWGGYLPIIDALRDSIDLLQVQLYNSGTMYGIDGGIYTQGTADFIVAMTEAVIQGFNTQGGYFAGLPAHKVAVGLPACTNAAGGGYVDPTTTASAINYLMGNGPQPGTYSLENANGYPNLGGMMTWSINWDAVANCGSAYQYAGVYEEIFGTPTTNADNFNQKPCSIYPNPSNGVVTVEVSDPEAMIVISDLAGREIMRKMAFSSNQIILEKQGVYFLNVIGPKANAYQKIVVSN